MGVRTTQPAALAWEYSEPAAQPAAAKQYLLPVVSPRSFSLQGSYLGSASYDATKFTGTIISKPSTLYHMRSKLFGITELTGAIFGR